LFTALFFQLRNKNYWVLSIIERKEPDRTLLHSPLDLHVYKDLKHGPNGFHAK